MRLARTLLIAVVIVLASLAAPMRGSDASAPGVGTRALIGHGPIDIGSNAGFTAANGVVSGTGSASDPYVIAGWSITAAGSFGIQIRNTAAHALLRDLEVTDASLAALYFFSVANVTVTNVTANFNAGDGLRFESSRSVSVVACNVTGNANGIVLLNTAFATVRDTSFTANAGDGALLTGSPNVTLEGNRFAYDGFGGGHGIDLAFTTGDAIQGNAFIADGIFLEGDQLAYYDSHVITSDNLVGGLPVLYQKDCVGPRMSGADLDLGQVIIAGCRHTWLSNLTVTGAEVGIDIAFGFDAVIGANVTVFNAAVGVRIQRSDAVVVAASSLLDTAVGVEVDASTNVSVRSTKIAAPFASTGPYDGVLIQDSETTNVSGNVIRHHRYGVAMTGSGNVSVANNVVQYDVVGVNATLSRDLRIAGNMLVQDSAGMWLQNVTNATISGTALLAILGTGANVSGSSGLTFVRNAFRSPQHNAHDTLGAGDAWDGGYPAGGNFWADYTGVDQCHGAAQNNCTAGDGLGDTAYAFAVNAVDRYPLMVSPVTEDVPPEALLLVGPAVGTVLTPFRATANLSSDFEDPLASLQVRWSWDGGRSWTPWTMESSAVHWFDTPGVHTIDLEVRDTTGLTDGVTGRVTLVPKPDLQPPAILFGAPATADVRQPIRIVANLTDPSGIANATLLYQGVDGGPFLSLPMQVESGGTNFTATIPAQPHTGTVAVVLFANDTWANAARAPVAGTATIRVVDLQTQLLVSIGVPLIAAAILAIGATWFLLRRRRRGRKPSEATAPTAVPPGEGGPPPPPNPPPGNP